MNYVSWQDLCGKMEIRLLSTWPICQESPDNDYNEHDHNDDQDDKECIQKEPIQ